MSNRLNSIRESAIVVVMQRVHEEDVSGAILEDGGYEHYCIPMEYDSGRHCTTSIGWTDPRSVDGELAWPERFSRQDLQTFKRNPYLWSGQYQQMPVPRGGGLFKFDWFQSYPVPASKSYDFVPLYTVASLDTAFKEKEENDYSALTVWSVYEAPKTGQRRIMLMDAWQKRLQLHGTRVERNPDEDEKSYLRRAAKSWGLCEWVAFTCSKRRVNTLLIEDSSRGTDVNNEIKRLFADRGWGTQLIPARGDKWSRAHSVVDLFTDEMIYAPGEWQGDNWVWRDFADIVINQACAFPRAAHDDLVDSMVQALRYLRDNGLAIRRDEKLAEDFRRAIYKPPSIPLYDV
jgi:predicted phage terminase large subunit-like protein